MEMHSKDNEGKSVVAGSFIRTLNNKIHNEMTSVSKNVFIDKLDNTVNQYNNMHHRTIKMKPVDVISSTHILISIKRIIRKILNLSFVTI